MNDNLKYGKLKNIRTLGIFFGTFAPAHKGHYAAIARSSMENDASLVVVSGRKGDRGDVIGLPLERRFRYMREVVAKETNILVEKLCEDSIPQMPEGWDAWFAMILEIIARSVIDYESLEKIVWYVGKKAYEVELQKRLPQIKHEIVSFERSDIPITSEMIRKNPRNNWRYILKPFRRVFTRKVLVCGTASGGKTTLVRKLATLYGTAYSEEYARSYQQTNNVRDDELERNDYLYLATGQFENNKNAIWSAANTGIVFCDTDVVVTEMYAQEDFGDDYDKSVFTRLISKEEWDLIFIIPPVTQYIDDGFRNMSQSDENYRRRMHKILYNLLTQYGFSDKIVELDATDDNGGYYARFRQAQKEIRKMYSDIL